MSQLQPLLFGGNYPIDVLQQHNMQKSILGVLCFTKDQHDAQLIKSQSRTPTMLVPLGCLDVDESICECWISQAPKTEGKQGNIYYQHDGSRLFGFVHVTETAFKNVENKTSLQLATESAYSQIFALLEQLNYPHVFRFWNYMADINEDNGELERYRQFNLGRYHAFLSHDRDTTGNVPAACALGFKRSEFNLSQETLSIAFLAGRVQPTAIENPRQISAYQYPEQYGPVSPTFSRANLVKLNQSELLLISGTASIVGHATQHVSNAVVQAREAMSNIEAIVDQANRISSVAKYTLANLHYRVYVRHPAHMMDIQKELKRYIGGVPIVKYFQADICRQDLLLEIEATMECPYATPLEMKV